MQRMKQSETLGPKTEILVVLRDDATNLTPQTGVTASAGDIKIGKGHAAEANHAGTWTEIGLGRYTYQFTAGEIDTLGVTHFAFKKTGVREFNKEILIVPWDEFLNQDSEIAGLPAAIWDLVNGIETGLTPRNALRLIAGSTAAVIDGAAPGAGTAHVKNAFANAKTRMTITYDANGNRTAITYDLT